MQIGKYALTIAATAALALGAGCGDDSGNASNNGGGSNTNDYVAEHAQPFLGTWEAQTGSYTLDCNGDTQQVSAEGTFEMALGTDESGYDIDYSDSEGCNFGFGFYETSVEIDGTQSCEYTTTLDNQEVTIHIEPRTWTFKLQDDGNLFEHNVSNLTYTASGGGTPQECDLSGNVYHTRISQ